MLWTLVTLQALDDIISMLQAVAPRLGRRLGRSELRAESRLTQRGDGFRTAGKWLSLGMAQVLSPPAVPALSARFWLGGSPTKNRLEKSGYPYSIISNLEGLGKASRPDPTFGFFHVSQLSVMDPDKPLWGVLWPSPFPDSGFVTQGDLGRPLPRLCHDTQEVKHAQNLLRVVWRKIRGIQNTGLQTREAE